LIRETASRQDVQQVTDLPRDLIEQLHDVSFGFVRQAKGSQNVSEFLLKHQKPPKDTLVGSGMATVITNEHALAFDKSKTEKFKKFGIKAD
jgi:hypothetical protein